MEKYLFLFLLTGFVSVKGTQEVCARTVTMTEVAAAPSTIGLQAGDVVTISTKEELFAFAKFANLRNMATKDDVYGELENITYLLMADIDLSGASWSAVGLSNINPFNGIFDGQGHIISNLRINDNKSDELGFFRYVGDNNKKGCVKNLCIDNINVSNAKASKTTSTAGLVGFLVNSEVENCRVFGQIYGTGYVGGIVGSAINSQIKNCCNTATVEVPSSGTCAGGIVGQMSGTNISFSWNGGNVSYRGFYPVTQAIGSLCGEAPNATSSISQCFFLNATAGSAYPSVSEQKNALFSRTADQFSSGQVAYELSLENPEAWGQWLTPGVYKDSLPNFFNAEKHPAVTADSNNPDVFFNDGIPVVYYSAALPSDGENIFYGRDQWHQAVSTRLSAHANELAFADATWEDLMESLHAPGAVSEVDNLLCRASDASGWIVSHLLVTDRQPFASPCAFSAKKVTYERQLYKDGGYESWYFPLDISVSQLPAGYHFELYDGSDTESNTVSFSILSSDVTELSGDMPYLLKYVGQECWTTPATVRIQWENVSWPASVELRNADIVAETGFYGTLAGQTSAESNAHLYTVASDGQSLSTLAAGKVLNPFRSYFYHVAGGAARIAVLHRDMTSIDAIATGNRSLASPSVYDLQGRPVSEKNISGVKIRNGKKILKK